jgi:division protein CdvB (Snf7/Vps24/ESCRT-III family)
VSKQQKQGSKLEEYSCKLQEYRNKRQKQARKQYAGGVQKNTRNQNVKI